MRLSGMTSVVVAVLSDQMRCILDAHHLHPTKLRTIKWANLIVTVDINKEWIGFKEGVHRGRDNFVSFSQRLPVQHSKDLTGIDSKDAHTWRATGSE